MGSAESASTEANARQRPTWTDNAGARCEGCAVPFSLRVRRHHCRECGGLVCAGCSRGRVAIPALGYQQPVRICRDCVNGTRSLKEALSDLFAEVDGRAVARGKNDARERKDRRNGASASAAIQRRMKREKKKAALREGAKTGRTNRSIASRGSAHTSRSRRR